MNTISYRQGNNVSVDDFIELLRASTLGERRPIHNREVMQGMVENGNVMISAWDGDQLVGVARTLTDFHNVAYLADLAVHVNYQRQGIGKRLIEKTQDALKPTCFMVLLSAPDANDYYPKVGFEHNPRAWTMERRQEP